MKILDFRFAPAARRGIEIEPQRRKGAKNSKRMWLHASFQFSFAP